MNKEEPIGRWFRVIGDRFDWVVRPTLMRSWKKGQIGFGTKNCIDVGLKSGVIEVIRKPNGAYVGKDGQVYYK